MDIKVHGMIADHPTPKVKIGDGAFYHLRSRDFKGGGVVIYSIEKQPQSESIFTTTKSQAMYQ